MPPLLCPSPIILDHSFPRNAEELRTAAVALGEIQACVERNDAHVALAPIFREIVRAMDWQQPPAHLSLLRDIWHYLNWLCLQPNERVCHFDIAKLPNSKPHPLPCNCNESDNVELWAEEVGKLLHAHDCSGIGTQFFIGIVCAHAFAGGQLCSYDSSIRSRVFPLVGPAQLCQLHDGYEWELSKDIISQEVKFSEAKQNIHLLGAIAITKPSSGGSHYQVKFPFSRTWPLDRNLPSIPNTFLSELTQITKLPLPVIKQTLITGVLPPRACRLASILTNAAQQK